MEVIGKPLDRVDGRLKVTGAATYAAEFQLPNLAYACLIQSGVGAGRVTRVDDSLARKVRGVIKIITFENAPSYASPSAQPTGNLQPLFGGPEVDYSGQHLGVVIADTFERARHAASLMRFEYEAKPPRIGLDQWEKESFEQRGPTIRGNVSAGRTASAQILEATYETPSEHHNPLEPHATIASWEGDKLTVYDATQGVGSSRRTLAGTFGISQENIRVICPFVGGGFGCKGSIWPHVSIAAMAAKETGRPVKLVLRRQEMFSGCGHRAETKQVMEFGAQTDGTLTLMRHLTTNETSQKQNWTESTGRMTGMMYGCANAEIENRLVRLNKMAPTFMRAPGEAIGSFALECAMDELAEKLGIDPIEFRLRNETDTDLATQKPFSSRALKQCLTVGRERFGWNARPQKPATLRQGRYLIGYGVGCGTYPANFRPSSARVSIAQNGRVLVQTASHDLGTGAYTIFTQIAADTLGVPPESVRVELGDTNLPEGVLAGGSVTSASTGSAILDGAQELKNAIIALASTQAKSPFMGTPVTELSADNGRVFVTKTPTRNIAYTDLLKLANLPRMEVIGDNGRAQRPDLSYYSFGAHFARVRVDLELGQVRVDKMLGVYGAGRILNAKTARSQMLGGMIWGIGMALHEETMYDPNTGRVVTRNLADYHVPSCADAPEIEVEFVTEEDTKTSPVGAKGVGELGIVGVAASIANAIYNATGKRVRELPILPDKLI